MKEAPLIIVQLVHLHGPMKGEIQEFSEPVIAIGRHPGSLVRFPADLVIVSRKHAEITRDGNRFKLIDHSANGTFVNGKKVAEAYLKDGDVLTFSDGGPKVSFLTHIQENRSVSDTGAKAPSQEAPPPLSGRPVSLRPPVAPEPPPVASSRSAPPAPPPHFQQPEPIFSQPVNAPLIFQFGPTLRSFKQLPVTIGKHPSCQARIEHPAVLDMHVQISYSSNQYWVKDLTGRGLVQINGRQISAEAPLSPEDILSLSPSGPVFKFLGGGRLAEVDEAPSEPQTPSFDERKDLRDSSEASKTDKERKSLLRRFLLL